MLHELRHPHLHAGLPELRWATRYGLPLGFLGVGLILLAIGGNTAMGIGTIFVCAAVLVPVANLMIRLSLNSQDDRDREQAARRRFRRTGRWS